MVRVGIFLIAAILSSSTTHAHKRVALIVGNSAYQHAPRLTNPRNDAEDIANALRQLSFEVMEGFDLNKRDLESKVRDFSAALRGSEAGVFFYAGHGLQVAGQNYLVPIDAKAETADALDWEMVRLDLVQRTMERATTTNILFLDACRNNPLARNLARAMGERSAEIGRGLAPMESGVGTLISFSTQPGNVALDGAGRNSPFAGALAKRMSTSSDDLSAVLIDVRNDVRKETQNRQIPWEHSALTGRFYFSAAAKTVIAAPAADSAAMTALKEQLANLQIELQRQQQAGTSTAKEIAALREELGNREAELKRRESELRKQTATAPTLSPPIRVPPLHASKMPAGNLEQAATTADEAEAVRRFKLMDNKSMVANNRSPRIGSAIRTKSLGDCALRCLQSSCAGFSFFKEPDSGSMHWCNFHSPGMTIYDSSSYVSGTLR